MVGEKEGLKPKKRDLRDVEYLAPQAQILIISMLRKTFPKENRRSGVHTAQNFRLRRSKTVHLYEGKVSNVFRINASARNACQTQPTFMPRNYGGEKGGLKLKTKDF